jgi:hypothetical protein
MVAKSATASLILVLAWAARLEAQGIAAGYPGDTGIQGHPDVILVEMFEEPAVANVAARWTNVKDGGNLSIDADAPVGSPGTRSLRITAAAGTTGGHLYQSLQPGENDRIHLRYYVKYLSGNFHHSMGGLGGYNPPTPWPQGTAGIVPTGSDHFTIQFEPVDNTTLRAEFYVYWKDMQGIWGNYFINDPALRFTRDRWTCVEIMARLNNPPSSANGELAVWIDGQPQGAFTNLQWRTVSALNLNYIWMSNYATVDPKGSLKFDHLVAARSYIGPIGGGAGPTPAPAPAPAPVPAPAPAPGTSGGGGSDNPNGDGSLNDRLCGLLGAEGMLLLALLRLATRRRG